MSHAPAAGGPGPSVAGARSTPGTRGTCCGQGTVPKPSGAHRGLLLGGQAQLCPQAPPQLPEGRGPDPLLALGVLPNHPPPAAGTGGDRKDEVIGQRGSTGSPSSLLCPPSCWAPFTPGTPFAGSTSAATPRRLPPSPGPAATNTFGGAQTCLGFPHVTGTQDGDCPHLLLPQGQGLLDLRSHGRCRGDPTTAPCPSRAVTNVPVTGAAAR